LNKDRVGATVELFHLSCSGAFGFVADFFIWYLMACASTLLIIDNDETVRLRLAAHLQEQGFMVLQASSAAQGLRLLEQESPSLLICDLRMHGLNALQLFGLANSQETRVPVIVLSAAEAASDVVEALRWGASDYLIKPLTELATLDHSVRRALDRVRLRLENRRYREKLEAANRDLADSLRLLEEDQTAGRQVQLNILPESPLQIDDLHLAHRIIPSLYLSGDFVDYFRVDEHRVAFYLADVSGHGASSAFVTVLLKFMTIRLLYESRRGGKLPEFRPSDILAHINHGLLNCNLGKHLTMLGGVIDQRQNSLTYSIGGHLPLPILFTDDKACYLQGKGQPLGLFADARYADQTLDLPENFSLSLYSDGIFDLLPGESLQDKEVALLDKVREAGGNLDGLCERLGLNSLGEIKDDIALLVLSRTLA